MGRPRGAPCCELLQRRERLLLRLVCDGGVHHKVKQLAPGQHSNARTPEDRWMKGVGRGSASEVRQQLRLPHKVKQVAASQNRDPPQATPTVRCLKSAQYTHRTHTQYAPEEVVDVARVLPQKVERLGVVQVHRLGHVDDHELILQRERGG